MIQPTGRAVLLLLAGLPVAVLPSLVAPGLWPLWAAVAAASVGLIAIDAWLAPAPRRCTVTVQAPAVLAVGAPGVAEIDVALAGRGGALPIEARLEVSPELGPSPAALLDVAPGAAVRWRVPLRARRRGTVTLRALWLRWAGPLGLVRRLLRQPLDRAIAVTPDLRPVRLVALRFFSARQVLAGVKVQRYLGDGSEFEALREFQPGFDHRALDWKASARHRQLLTRHFRAERNHQVVMAIDTGHLMAEPLDGVARLDHAVHGALLLAYVGLKTGDRVGLHAFDAGVRQWHAPVGGVRAFARLQARAATLDYSTHATNFTLGLTDLATRLSRRSLIVAFTDFVDSTSADLMVANLGRLARRHVVIFVALRDPLLDALADAVPSTPTALHEAVVADDLRRERARVLRTLAHRSVHVVDARPDQVSAALLNRYLDIRRRELV